MSQVLVLVLVLASLVLVLVLVLVGLVLVLGCPVLVITDSIRVPSLKFVGLPVPKIRLIFNNNFVDFKSKQATHSAMPTQYNSRITQTGNYCAANVTRGNK